MRRSAHRHVLLALAAGGVSLAIAMVSLAAPADSKPTTAAKATPASRPADALTAGFKLMPLKYEVQHPYDLKLEERYSYDKATDTHDLWCLFTDKPHAPPPNKTAARTEFRLQDEGYKAATGQHMLDCDMYIVPGTIATITQVFGTGPMAMIEVDAKGTITDLRTHFVIAKDMNGKWFNWKVIHDTDLTPKAAATRADRSIPGAIRIYIDGQLVDDKVAASWQQSYYFKCGVYSRHEGEKNEVKIRGLKYWVKESDPAKVAAAIAKLDAAKPDAPKPK